MNCICGCGRRLETGQVDFNLLAGEVALELAVWDRARALRSPVAADRIQAVIESGSEIYQGMLAEIHDGAEPRPEGVQDWLRGSRASRQQVSVELPVVPKKRIKLSNEESDRIDRAHPERSFSGGGGHARGPLRAPASGSPQPQVAEMPTALGLELGSLLQAGRDGDAQYERFAVDWLGRLIFEHPPSLDELRWLLGRLEDARSGRIEEAEPALRRFLAERS